MKILLSCFLFFFLHSCNNQTEVSELTGVVDSEQLLADIQFLASDELGGRRTGTDGNRLARKFIIERFTDLNLTRVNGAYEQLFDFAYPGTEAEYDSAVNVIGQIEGRLQANRFIAVTAHYDHLGIRNGEIYNGADDNASGVAGLLAIAQYFTQSQPENSILFIAFDGEEHGLQGARHFIENPVVPLEQIILNVNLDMISTNFENELYAVGTNHYPFLKPLVQAATLNAPVNVLFGYDSEQWPQDWTSASDHGPFHEKEIPFIYFGVEDHEHYHQPSDTFENINPDFFIHSVETIIDILVHVDNNLDEIETAAKI